MELTVQNVYGLLLRSRLLSREDAKAMFARWQAEAGSGASNLARFAAWMVSNRYLTAYQAGLLARGHADSFFLNEYKVLDRLGKGRMAGVYRAQHRFGQVVAIKVLPPSKAKDPTLLARFQREARLALRLKHPNIVRAFQTGEAAGLHYLVMEYLEGETLEDVLGRRKKFLPAEAVRLVYQALQGLQHIHETGLVHRDLKPADLMLVWGPGAQEKDSTLRATVKILDIGLGRALFEDGGAPDHVDSALTGEGVLLGTPDYLSPEQARDPRAADIRSDIYSLGCVLYHLLGGQSPFPDSNIISQMIRHATEAPRPLKELNPAVPDGLQQVVSWMLAKDPAGRYPTPERAAQALQVFLAAGSVPAAPLESDPGMRSYLTWLEVELGKDGPAAPAPQPAAPPVAAAAPAGPAKPPSVPAPVAGTTGERVRPARPSRPPDQPQRSRPSGKRRLRSHAERGNEERGNEERRSSSAPPAPPPAEYVPEFSVELVPLPAAAIPGKPPSRGTRLTRRDFLFFGVGAVAGTLATFLGCLVALAGKRDKGQPWDGSPEPSHGDPNKEK